MTSADAQGLASGLLDRGRKQTNDVLKDLEGLLAAAAARSRAARPACARRAGGAVGAARGQASGARSRAVRAASPAAGAGRPRAPRGGRRAELPDHRLRRPDGRPGGDPAHATSRRRELRKVRDYERRNANRKTVLNSIETKLG